MKVKCRECGKIWFCKKTRGIGCPVSPSVCEICLECMTKQFLSRGKEDLEISQKRYEEEKEDIRKKNPNCFPRQINSPSSRYWNEG